MQIKDFLKTYNVQSVLKSTGKSIVVNLITIGILSLISKAMAPSIYDNELADDEIDNSDADNGYNVHISKDTQDIKNITTKKVKK